MSVSVNTVKCVDRVPGAARYCCSVVFPVTPDNVGSPLLASVVQPYEHDGVFDDRIVDVSNLSVSVSANVSEGDVVFGTSEIGVFDTAGNVNVLSGKYVIPFDQGIVEIGDCGGALVVAQGNVFGVKLSLSAEGTVSGFRGVVCVNFEFSLVGHSL